MALLTVSFIVHKRFDNIYPALQSLYQHTNIPCIVYVVVNVGNPPDIEALRKTFPTITVLVNKTPLGFAANHNRVLQLAQTPYIALLNDDILLTKGAVDTLVAYMEENPRVGIAGASLRNPDGSPQVSVYSDPKLLLTLYKISGLSALTGEGTTLRRWLQRSAGGRLVKLESWQPQLEARAVPVVKGAAMLVRRTAYEQVGAMDETTRMYGEEIDWHLRFRKLGWIVAYVPNAVIIHKGVGQRISPLTLVEDRKSLLNYYLKHRSPWQAAIVRIAIIIFNCLQAALWLPFDRTRAVGHMKTVQMGLRWHRPRTGAAGHEQH